MFRALADGRGAEASSQPRLTITYEINDTKVQTSIVQAQFETIHPFIDGNGRTGRAIIHALLKQKGVIQNATAPISGGLFTDTSSYFQALHDYRN